MAKALSIKLTAEQVERLEKLAGRYHLKPSQMSTTFLEEKMREEEFPHIHFREGFENRQAYIAGTRLKVWMMERMARHCAEGARAVCGMALG